jgi:hypothetical protein
MNDREAMICRLKELRYSNTYCILDTLIRIDEDVQCTHCAFKDTDKLVYFLGCPFNWGCTFGNNKNMVK